MAGGAQPGPSTQKPPANITTPPVPSMVPGPKASTSTSQKKRCGRAKVAPTPTAAAVAASGLKSKYHDQHAQFKGTGSGVAPPDNGDNPPNLHEDVIATFPYYKELHAVWGGVPSFDSQLVSSKPKVNHAENLLKIVLSRPNANQSIDEDNEMQDGVEGGDDEGNKEPGPNVEVGASLQPEDPAGYDNEIEMYHLAANPLISTESLWEWDNHRIGTLNHSGVHCE
ncbi:hypothetical protein V8E55_011278 [Tylopilus felleus]